MVRRVVTALALAVLLASCGSSNGEVSTGDQPTPGYEATPPTISDAPFEYPGGPRDGVPTTLSDGFFEDSTSSSTTTTSAPPPPQTTAPPPPTTTSTTIADAPIVKRPEDVTDLCGFTDLILSFQRLPGRSPAETQRFARSLPQVMDRYVEIAPEEARADLRSIRTTLASLVEDLEASGWDARRDPFAARSSRLYQDENADDAFVARLRRVNGIEDERCD
jgi:hypothetical protein